MIVGYPKKKEKIKTPSLNIYQQKRKHYSLHGEEGNAYSFQGNTAIHSFSIISTGTSPHSNKSNQMTNVSIAQAVG